MEPPVTPRLPPLKRRRVEGVQPTPPPRKLSDLLASFGASQSPMSTKRMAEQSHSLRPKPAVTYAESESSSLAAMSPQSSFANSPVKSDADNVDDNMSEDEDDTIHVLPPASKANGTRQSLGRSTKKQSSYAPPARVYKKTSKTKGSKGGRGGKRLLTSDTGAQAVQEPRKAPTARAAIRQDIAELTKPKRDAFLLANYDLFAPLLPENNYIDKLERVHAMGDDEDVNIIPHPKAVTQPKGIKATMKPYQLEGLSFLVHMYNNGMSAILGDEMGLGKTLQTLSLFKYVKETDPIAFDGEARPYLVVCPLSVLSSWINEATRWTPDFKVIRFHGPKVERERLKQETMGMLDRYGQQTAKSKAKAKASRQKRAGKVTEGKNVINLDSSDEEEDIAKPVDLVITTYETFVAEQNWFKRAFAWRYVVLDEGHKVKNDKSDVSSALQSMSAEHKLLLTGTPLQNNLQELWALLHWLYPEVFTLDSATSFKHAFDLSNGKASTSFMNHARRLLEIIMLRRMKNSPGVNLDLPPKEEVLLFVPLTPMQRFWYTRLLTKMDNALLDDLFKGAKMKEERAIEQQEAEEKNLAVLEQATNAVGGGDVWAESKEIIAQTMGSTEEPKGSDWHKLMNLIMQLRKCCSHPYLLPGAKPDPYYLGDHIRTSSGKFVVLDKLVQELVLSKQKKVLIFSQFTRTLDLVEDLLALKGGNASSDPAFRYNRFDGSTGRAKRNLGIRLFNDMRTDFRVMLISTRAGGLGINLTSATDVVFMDEDWNPQVTLQAEARAHRIGQTKKVTVYKLCTQGTVEEQMMSRIRKKLYLSAKITESMRNLHTVGEQDKKRKRGPSSSAADDDAPQLAASELKTLLRRGAQTLSAPQVDVTEMMSWDWQTTLEKCKDKANDPHVTDPTGSTKVEEVDEEAWLNNIERVESAVFEGKVHQRKIEKEEKAKIDLIRSDRRAGKNTTVMVDGFAINKESLNCADWEAVPTMAGKDPRLAEPKREKKEPINHQEHCQVCWDGGDMYCCTGCPRSYHLKCIPAHLKGIAKARFGNFYCSQHQCFDCEKKTAEAGGMIYRCRWCEKGYCEDCLDWDSAQLIGEGLPELEMLKYTTNNGWYMSCPDCVAHWEEDPADMQRCIDEKDRIEKAYDEAMMGEEFVAAGVDQGTSTPTTVSEAMTPVETTLPVSKKAKTGLLGKTGGFMSA